MLHKHVGTIRYFYIDIYQCNKDEWMPTVYCQLCGRCVNVNFLINPMVVNRAVNFLSVKQHANFANKFFFESSLQTVKLMGLQSATVCFHRHSLHIIRKLLKILQTKVGTWTNCLLITSACILQYRLPVNKIGFITVCEYHINLLG
jgi:hypothetical protein